MRENPDQSNKKKILPTKQECKTHIKQKHPTNTTGGEEQQQQQIHHPKNNSRK
jgi:hypothetical protein